MQSTYWDPQYGPERGEAAWTAFVRSACGISTPSNECLRSNNVSSENLVTAWTTAVANGFNPLAFNPVIDGPAGLLPGLPSQLLPQTRIPVILGSTLDEGSYLYHGAARPTLMGCLKVPFSRHRTSTHPRQFANGSYRIARPLLVVPPHSPGQPTSC
jgi:hypothetical protein